MKKFNQARYIQEYNKSHYRRIMINLSKPDYEFFKKYVAERGESMSGFFYRAAKNQVTTDTANAE